jgi:hypothetical protein
MLHPPVILWIVLAIIPVVIGLLLHVEATVVQPSIKDERRAKARAEAERRAKAREAGRPERSQTAARF